MSRLVDFAHLVVLLAVGLMIWILGMGEGT
jgi:hypothetical protein